jgi:hypothetical protein
VERCDECGFEYDLDALLEYAGHVRDILFVQRERVLLALVEEVPTFVPMHRDERVPFVADNERDPAVVSEELAVAADPPSPFWRQPLLSCTHD